MKGKYPYRLQFRLSEEEYARLAKAMIKYDIKSPTLLLRYLIHEFLKLAESQTPTTYEADPLSPDAFDMFKFAETKYMVDKGIEVAKLWRKMHYHKPMELDEIGAEVSQMFDNMMTDGYYRQYKPDINNRGGR